jgi:hypothetical protein
MRGYFTNGSNWLQLRPPKTRIPVFRMSYIARKKTKRKEREARSQPERFLWKKSEFYERQ